MLSRYERRTLRSETIQKSPLKKMKNDFILTENAVFVFEIF